MHPQTDEPIAPLSPWWGRVVKYGIVVVTAIFYLTVTLNFGFTPDASYVSFRVASNIAGGEGCVFNPGQQSDGTSGPVWLLILAAGSWGGLDVPLVAKTFDLVFACLALFAVYFLAFLILRDKVAAFFAALLFSVDAWVLRSSASGLGYSLALLFTLVVLWYGFRREYGIASFVCGFLVLTAPLEGSLLFAIMMVDAVAIWRRENLLWTPLLRSVALVLIPVIPWVAYSLVVSGVPLVHSVVGTYTATPSFGPGGEPVGSLLVAIAESSGVFLALLVVGHVVAIRRSDWRLLAPSSFPLLWVCASVVAALVVEPSGFWRTWVLVVPVIVIYGLLGLYYLSVFLIGVGRRGTVALLVVVVVSLLSNQIVYQANVLPEMKSTVREMQEQVRPLAHWLRSHVRKDATILAPFGGMIGWISGLRVKTSASLWTAGGPDGEADTVTQIEGLRHLVASLGVTAVVDRSRSVSRLDSLGLVPIRTLREGAAGNRAGGLVYTVYADRSWRDSVEESPQGPKPEDSGKQH